MRRNVRAGRAIIEYDLIQTARKSIEMRVSPGHVTVFAPRGIKLGAADGFVRERADWLADAMRRLQEAQKAHDRAHPMEDGAQVLCEGRALTLKIKRGARKLEIRDEVLSVTLPDASPEAVRDAVRAFLIARARSVIAARLDHFIPLIGRAPGRVAIREQRTRWGSCSSKHNLNFNWKLIMAPGEALSYVVVHELCHLYEFNHSPKFWAMVERFMPDYRQWVKWLKQNGAYLGV